MNEGTLDQFIRFIKDGDFNNEENFKIVLRNRLTIEQKDKIRYLTELRDKQDSFNDIFQKTINSALLNLSYSDPNEKTYTPTELSKILKVNKSTITNWIKTGIFLHYNQTEKGHKIEIGKAEIDRIVELKPKYKNAWENYNFK